MADSVNVPIALLTSAMLAIGGAMLKMWADVQTMKEKHEGFDEACKKVATHETEIALLKATVTRLETIPDKLDRMYDLMRSKA